MNTLSSANLEEKLLKAAKQSEIADAASLETFLQQKKQDGRRLDQMLLESGLFTEDQVLKLFAQVMGLEYLEHISVAEVPVEFVEKVPSNYAQHHGLIATGSSKGVLTIAMSEPLRIFAVDNVSKMMSCEVRPALATRATINSAINAAYEQRVTVLEDVAGEVGEDSLDGLIREVTSSEDLLDVVNRPPVIRLVNDILFRALQLRASDVHVHPFEQKVSIRYRIDGVLYDMLSLDQRILPVIVSRIKVMAAMDIAERRMPQDGRCSVRIGPREVDLRVSTVPTAYGERTVLRLLDKTTGIYDLGHLGLPECDIKKIDELLTEPHGVMFVTGPTGSGKTTTLYSFLRRIDATQKNIMTVEDPIEYQLDGISQIQVASKKGMTFVTALRHILRQDPDVIMVGEVRDQETARMVIQSSLTGHLVFSTVHTNDAAGAITRILDLGVEPYLVASSISSVLAQRLVRRLCPHCKELITSDSDRMKELGIQFASFEKVYQAVGCSKCFQTGYLGRTGIYELMVVNDDIRQCVYQRTAAGEIKKVALETGMSTLRMDGLLKVEQGVTSLEEVLRVSHMDDT